MGLAAGAAIAGVDNFAFGGEVSPIVIVVLLLATTSAVTAAWGRRGLLAAGAAWIGVPLAHLGKLTNSPARLNWAALPRPDGATVGARSFRAARRDLTTWRTAWRHVPPSASLW